MELILPGMSTKRIVYYLSFVTVSVTIQTRYNAEWRTLRKWCTSDDFKNISGFLPDVKIRAVSKIKYVVK